MKVVSTFHAPTSVTHSLKCCLTDNTAVEYLVVAKINKLEIFVLLPEGPKLEYTREIWGRVTSLKAVIGQTSSCSHLLLTLDHPDPVVLTFSYSVSPSSGHAELALISSENLHERGVREAEFFSGAAVNPQGTLAVVSTYPGKLRVIELDNGLFQSSSDTGIREYNLLYTCFLRTSSQQSNTLAMLYFDHTQQLMLTSYELQVSEIGTSIEASPHFPNFEVRDQDSFLLIPVPPHEKSAWNDHGGVLVLGGPNILFYSCSQVDRKKSKGRNNSTLSGDASTRRRKPIAQVHWPLAELAAWAPVGNEGIRFLLGDSFGRIALLTISLEVQKLGLLVLGDVSPPTSLTALSSQYFFVGSHFGDSQLVKITPEKSVSDGSYLEVMENFKNIAPILDAVALYPTDDDQPQIVTCSGGKSTGSLRVIRNGANFIEDFDLPGLAGVTGVWLLKTNFEDEFHTHLLVSTPFSTQLVQMPLDSHPITNPWVCITEEIFPGIQRSSRTLTAVNVARRTKTPGSTSSYKNGPYVIQVTPEAVFLLNMKTGLCEQRWTPQDGRDIVAASVNASQICIASRGGIITLLVLEENKIIFRMRTEMTMPEIAAITIVPLVFSKNYSIYIAVAYYGAHDVHVLGVRDLKRIGKAAVMPHLPCSLRFHDFGDGQTGPKPYVIVGLIDGTVALIPFENNTLGNHRIISLGDRPVHLSLCFIRGKEKILATGRRSAVFFWAKDTMQHSPVLMKDAVSTSYLNTKSYPSSLVSVSSFGVSIGRIQDLDKIHIRTIFMGHENPLRIAHHPAGKVFGVGFHRVRPIQFGDEEVNASFKILDETTFEILSEYALQESEQVTALNLVTPVVGGETKEYFAMGTMYYHKGEREPRRGRLLIFSTRPVRDGDSARACLIAESEMRGCVYSIVSLEGKVAVAVNTGVFLYGIETSSDTNVTTKLVQLAEWNHNYFLTSLAVRNGLLVTGDSLCSVAALKLVNSKFQTVAKHYTPLMPICIGISEDNSITGANAEGTLFSFKLPTEGDETPKLEQDGSYHIDDNVNKLIPARGGRGSLARQQLFFTAAGRIGVILRVDEVQALHLSGLQRNLGSVVKSPGDIDHATHRAPVNARGRSDSQTASFGFLDGDFLERFLDYSTSELKAILDGRNEAEKLKWTHEQYSEMLEELQGLH